MIKLNIPGLQNIGGYTPPKSPPPKTGSGIRPILSFGYNPGITKKVSTNHLTGVSTWSPMKNITTTGSAFTPRNYTSVPNYSALNPVKINTSFQAIKALPPPKPMVAPPTYGSAPQSLPPGRSVIPTVTVVPSIPTPKTEQELEVIRAGWYAITDPRNPNYKAPTKNLTGGFKPDPSTLKNQDTMVNLKPFVSGGVTFGQDQKKAWVPLILAFGAMLFLVFSFGGLFRKSRKRR